jgi:hypothetical protein
MAQHKRPIKMAQHKRPKVLIVGPVRADGHYLWIENTPIPLIESVDPFSYVERLACQIDALCSDAVKKRTNDIEKKRIVDKQSILNALRAIKAAVFSAEAQCADTSGPNEFQWVSTFTGWDRTTYEVARASLCGYFSREDADKILLCLRDNQLKVVAG